MDMLGTYPFEFIDSQFKTLEASGTEWEKAAKKAVARGYARLSAINSIDRLSEAEVYQMLCEDGYGSQDRSVIIAVVDCGGLSKKDELAGTIRLVFGRDETSSKELPALDAMNFIHLPSQWPHQLDGYSHNQAAELGRYTIVQKNGYLSYENKTRITNMLIKKAMDIAKSRGVEYVYGIMPSLVNRIMTASGVNTEYLDGSRLREDNLYALDIFKRFPLYWNNSPKLYRFISVKS